METLHILMIGGIVPWHPKAGGGHIITYKVSEAIANLGHIIDYVAIAPKKLQREIEWSNKVVYIEKNSWIIELRKFLKKQKSVKYDVIHIHEGNDTIGYGLGNYMETIMRNTTDNTISCLSMYTPEVHKFPRSIAEFYWKIISKNMDIIFALSNFSRNNISRAYNISKMKIHTTYAGVDKKFLNANKQQYRDIDNDCCFSIIFVGRLAGVQKGVDVLLHALPLIIEEHNNIRVNIIGDGPDREKYKQLAYKLGIMKYVNFLGFVEHNRIYKYYTKGDLFVLPSRRESFGLVLAEAMAVGLPVVSTRVGAIPEVVKDGTTGILVPPNNPQLFAEAVNYLLDHPIKRKRMGKRGKKWVKNMFTWEKVAKRVIRGYIQILS